MHIENKQHIGPTEGLHDTAIKAEAQYLIHFSRPNRKFCSSYNGNNSFLFVKATKICQFKAKDSETKYYPLCLGNILGDFSANNMQKTGLNGFVYDFYLDYKTFDTVSNIIDIHKYLIRIHDIK